MNVDTTVKTKSWPAPGYAHDEQLPADSRMLRELLEGTEFDQLFESFYTLLQVPISITDVRANVLFSSRWHRICTQFHRVHPEACRHCIDDDQQIALHLREGQSQVVRPCSNGLTDCASPIIIEHRHVANVLIGQFLTEPPDEERFLRQARAWNFDEKDYIEALREVPIVDVNRIPEIMGLLTRMTHIVTNLGVERKRAVEAQIRQALILDTIPQSVFWKDLRGAYVGCNRAFLKVAGLAIHEQIVGKTDHDLPWKTEAEAQRAADRAVLDGVEPKLHLVESILRADGSRRAFDTARLPLFDASGRICGVLGICEDITETESARAELLAAKERFRTAFMTGLDAYYIGTLEEGRLLEVNDEFTALTGWRRPEAIGKTSLELQLLDDPGERTGIVRELRAHGFIRDYETWFRTKERARIRISLSIRTMQIGGILLCLGAMRDTSAQWRARRRAESRNRLYAMLSGVNEAIARGELPVLDEACRLAVTVGKFRMAWIGLSGPGCVLVPVASAGFVDGYLDTLRITATGECAQGPTGRCRTSGEHALSLDIATDPLMAPWRDAALARGFRSSSAFPIKVGGEVIGVFTVYGDEPSAFSDDELALLDEYALDIGFALERQETEAHRLAMEQALAESEQRFRQIAESIDEVFWIIDPVNRKTLYVSPAYEKIWAQPCTVSLASIEAFAASIHPDDLSRVREAHALKLARGDFDETYRIIRPDGSERWIHDRAFVVRNAAGETIRIIGTASDITDRQKIEVQLRQAQKMEAIGVLAGGVAHDFNNLLAVILSYSALLMDDLEPGDRRRVGLEEIEGAANRAAELTRQLLAFSRQQVMQLRPLDLNAVVAGMMKLLYRLIGEDIRLTTRSLVDTATLVADPGQIEQVLMNLVVNARDAMPAGGSLTIEIGCSVLDDVQALPLALKAGCYVTLCVSDTGQGMDKATQARIFEPFFTTKPVGKGTGLGLASVFGIVKQSGGSVAVESEPGNGATFRIWLPSASEQVVQQSQGPVSAEDLDTAATVLLVEDDDRVRRLAHAILTRRGYDVLEAHSGGDALLICEQHKGPIDLVLTDVVMPLMSGDQLVERLRQVRPDLPVLFMSGYPDKATQATALTVSAGLLQKPFTPESLLRKVREARRCATQVPEQADQRLPDIAS